MIQPPVIRLIRLGHLEIISHVLSPLYYERKVVRRTRLIPAENGHLKPSRSNLVPANLKVCTGHIREALRFQESGRTGRDSFRESTLQHPKCFFTVYFVTVETVSFVTVFVSCCFQTGCPTLDVCLGGQHSSKRMSFRFRYYIHTYTHTYIYIYI